MADAHVVYAGDVMVLVLYEGVGPVWTSEGEPQVARRHPVVHGAFVTFDRRLELLALLDALDDVRRFAAWQAHGLEVVPTPSAALAPRFRPSALPPLPRA